MATRRNPLPIVQVDENDNILTSSGGTSSTDDAAFTPGTSSVTPIGAILDDASPDSVDEGDVGALRMTANRSLHTVIMDGEVQADVLDLTNNNPLTVAVVDADGTQVTAFGGGTQYTEGDTDTTITGTAAMMEVAADTLQPIQGTVAGGLLVNLGSNNDVTVTGSLTSAGNVTNAGTFAVQAAGDVAHDTADSGNPVKIGGYASSTVPTAVTAGDRVNSWMGLNGETIIGFGGVGSGGDGVNAGFFVDQSGVARPFTVGMWNGANFDRIRGDTSNGLDVDVTRVTGTVTIAGAVTNAGTFATQDAAAEASLAVLDDWDESDRAKVNPIAGQAGVQGASGVVTALTQRVVLATDVALPAGTNAIGKLAANSGVDIGDVDVTSLPALVAGTAAIGKLLPPDIDVTAHTNYIKKYYTSAGAATDGIIWSPAAGKRWHVVSLFINVSAAATVTLEDDLAAGDSAVLKMELAANSGLAINFSEQYPLASGEDAADLLITTDAGNVYVTCTGYEI